MLNQPGLVHSVVALEDLHHRHREQHRVLSGDLQRRGMSLAQLRLEDLVADEKIGRPDRLVDWVYKQSPDERLSICQARIFLQPFEVLAPQTKELFHVQYGL